MNSGRYILSQVLDLVDRKTLSRLVERYDAESRVRHFGCRQQLICMAFAQLTWREGLRDIATCLNARTETLYHLGFRQPVAKSTLADANDQRDWRLSVGTTEEPFNVRNKLHSGILNWNKQLIQLLMSAQEESSIKHAQLLAG